MCPVDSIVNSSPRSETLDEIQLVLIVCSHMNPSRNSGLTPDQMRLASGSGHPTAGRGRKYKSPATRAAEEAVACLQPPTLPEYLRGDDGDGPSGSEKKVKLRDCAPLLPLLDLQEEQDPDDHDRVMGIPSVQPPEVDRFGDVTDTAEDDQGVANDSSTSTPVTSCLNNGLKNYRGGDLDSRGYGSVNLADCLDRFGGVPSLAAHAACASEGAAEYCRFQPNPRHFSTMILSTQISSSPWISSIRSRENLRAGLRGHSSGQPG